MSAQEGKILGRSFSAVSAIVVRDSYQLPQVRRWVPSSFRCSGCGDRSPLSFSCETCHLCPDCCRRNR